MDSVKNYIFHVYPKYPWKLLQFITLKSLGKLFLLSVWACLQWVPRIEPEFYLQLISCKICNFIPFPEYGIHIHGWLNTLHKSSDYTVAYFPALLLFLFLLTLPVTTTIPTVRLTQIFFVRNQKFVVIICTWKWIIKLFALPR